MGYVLKIFLLALLLYQGSVEAQTDTIFICNPGDPVQLYSKPNQFAYLWTPNQALNNPTVANPIAHPTNHTTYTVQMISNLKSDNLIENPAMNQGRVGFTTEYEFSDWIRTQGLYGINEDPSNLNPFSFANCVDHTSGTGKMLVVDGSPVADEQVWCQSISVVPGANYAFSVWLTAVNPRNLPALQFSINGETIGDIFGASQTVCEWRQFFAVWNAKTFTRAEVCVVNQNINEQGNDFALDDFAFHEIEDLTIDSILVFVEAIEAAKDRNVFIPNIFSPNQDGVNDFFRPYFGKGAQKLLDFSVFDRWGGLVFQRKNCQLEEADCAWDGTQNGRLLETGDYVYLIKIQYADGENEVRTGTVRVVY